MKIVTLSVLLLASSLGWAQDLQVENFKIDLPGEWERQSIQGQTVMKSEAGRYLSISVFHPQSATDGMRTLMAASESLRSIQKSPGVQTHQDFQSFSNAKGAVYQAIQLKHSEGFLVGVTLGSNKGVMLLTYEGSGAVEDGFKEAQQLLESLSIN
jgi:hypothetical protein